MIAWADNLQLQHKVHRVKDTNTPKLQNRQQQGCQKSAKGCRVVLHKRSKKVHWKGKVCMSVIRCPLSVVRCLFSVAKVPCFIWGIFCAIHLSIGSWWGGSVRAIVYAIFFNVWCLSTHGEFCWFLFLPSSRICVVVVWWVLLSLTGTRFHCILSFNRMCQFAQRLCAL